MTDPKIAYLEYSIKMQAAINQTLAGAALVKLGGVEGILEVAHQQPQALLDAIASLADLVDMQKQMHSALLEDYFDLIDLIDKNAGK